MRTPPHRIARAHLAYLRRLPCLACGSTPSQAAHVRCGTDGGIGLKPSDRYAVPLCPLCHLRQHRVGELTFWSALRIDPLAIALRLWTVSGNDIEGSRIISSARLNPLAS